MVNVPMRRAVESDVEREEAQIPPSLPLDEMYPIEAMYSVRQSVRSLTAVVITATAYLTILPNPWLISPLSLFFFGSAMKLSICIFLITSLYWELYRRCFRYYSNRGRLILSRGILLRHHCSLPLLPLIEISVQQTALDALFGLYQVHVVTAVDPTKELGRIEGLNKTNAAGMYSVLTEILFLQQQSTPPHPGEDFDIEIE